MRLLRSAWVRTWPARRLLQHPPQLLTWRWQLVPLGSPVLIKCKAGVMSTRWVTPSIIELSQARNPIAAGPSVPLTADEFVSFSSTYPSEVNRKQTDPLITNTTKSSALFKKGVLHGERECKDVVIVTENSRLLLNKCGEIEEPLVIESSGDELNVTLQLKSQFIPKRGLLAYFTAMGCPTPKIPNKAHLVSGSNSTRAQFSCSADHVKQNKRPTPFPVLILITGDDRYFRIRDPASGPSLASTRPVTDGTKIFQIALVYIFKALFKKRKRKGAEFLKRNFPVGQPDIKEIHASGNKSLIHILKKAMNQSSGPEVSELNSYNITYGIFIRTALFVNISYNDLFV